MSTTIRDIVHARGCTAMGEYRCQIPMPLNGRLCSIDYCIADIVAALNAANIRTVMSCCGHGNESIARIDLEDGRALLVRGHSPNPSNPEVTPEIRADALWDALRLECCSTGLKAQRIVVLHKDDVSRALKRMTSPNTQAQERP